MSLVDTETGEVGAESISAEDARVLTDRIKVAVEGTWDLIRQAYVSRAWAALGHPSWDDYCTREFGTSRLRLPREERTEVVASLRDSGLSIRAIAAATGDSVGTVHAALSGVQDRTPDDSSAAPGAASMAPVEPDEEGGPGDDHAAGDPAPPDVDAALTATSAAIAAGLAARRAAEAAEAAAKRITGTDGKTYQPKAKPTAPNRKPLPDVAEKAGWEFRRAVERLERIASDDRFAANKEQVAAALRGHLTYAAEVIHDLLDGFDHQPSED